jgi:hypothetical protein
LLQNRPNFGPRILHVIKRKNKTARRHAGRALSHRFLFATRDHRTRRAGVVVVVVMMAARS